MCLIYLVFFNLSMDEENNKNKPIGTPLNIAIIGAGPVGSLCACYLARQGHNINIYEYREDIRTTDVLHGRSVNLALSARGRAALSEIGLEHIVIKEHGLPMSGRMIHNIKGSTYPIPYDVVNNQCIYSASRKYMNELLITAAEVHSNIKISFKTKLLSLNLKTGWMTLLRMETNEIVMANADLIIGADGAFSTVRKEILKFPMFNYSQEYIEHGYIELYIPPGDNGQFLMEPNYLHIWPRKSFMMIALPNQDKSWTVTLFMPLKKFTELNNPETLLQFFETNFSDALVLMTKNRLVHDYFSTTPSYLISIKCTPFHVENKVLLIGDAAHAMVPFLGQGLNAGFEDCLILDKLMSKYHSNLNLVLPEFSKLRCSDAEAICNLAMYNYIEMRDLVQQNTFLLRKKIDNTLYRLFSNHWLPLYNSVTFTNMKYSSCVVNKKFQDKVLWSVLLIVIGTVVIIIFHFCAGFTSQKNSLAN